MSCRWAVKKALPLTWVRVTVISAGMSSPPARRAVISMRWPRRGPPPVARWRARARRRGCSSAGGRRSPGLDEVPDRLPRVPAQDEELDPAARPVVLADDFAQGLQLSVVGGQPETQVELDPDLERDRRLEQESVDADVQRAALH